MDWLRAPEIQGMAALIAIGQVAFAIAKNLKQPGRAPAPAAENDSQPLSPSPSRIAIILGTVLFLVLGWIIYSIPWAIMASLLGGAPNMVLSVLFFTFGAFTALGVLFTKGPALGGFLGGGLPFAMYTLYSLNEQMTAMVSPFTWFAVSGIISGLIGAVTGQVIVRIMQILKLPIPLYK